MSMKSRIISRGRLRFMKGHKEAQKFSSRPFKSQVLFICAFCAFLWQTPLAGDIRQVHDPNIIKDGDTYYLFSTRAGIAIRCSKDLTNWRLCGDVFAHLPEWA